MPGEREKEAELSSRRGESHVVEGKVTGFAVKGAASLGHRHPKAKTRKRDRGEAGRGKVGVSERLDTFRERLKVGSSALEGRPDSSANILSKMTRKRAQWKKAEEERGDAARRRRFYRAEQDRRDVALSVRVMWMVLVQVLEALRQIEGRGRAVRKQIRRERPER